MKEKLKRGKEAKISKKSHIALHKSHNSGITLVALIITIIVLLILAVVAIRAVQEDGIIQHAKNAKSATTVAQEKEQIGLAVNEWQIQKNYQNEPGSFKSFMKDKLSDVATIPNSDPDAGPLTVTMKDTGNVYTVKDDGTITGPKEIGNLSDLERYILGENGEGRDLFGIINPSSMVFLQDPDDSSSIMHQKVKFASASDKADVYIRYNRNVYKFSIMQDENGVLKTVKDSLTLVNTPAGNLGKYVTYQGKTWIVFREDADVGVELISANALGSVTLGGEDFDNARTSYNNAISTLTQACKDATGITGNIRNVGGPAEDETTGKVVFSTLTEFTPGEGVTFGDYEGEINGLKVGDEKYQSDYEQMENLGILATDTPTTYWLASRFVYEYSSGVHFSMRCVDYDGGLGYDDLCHVNSSGDSGYSTRTYAVRPVVSLSSGIIDSATQSGTIDDPIILQ